MSSLLKILVSGKLLGGVNYQRSIIIWKKFSNTKIFTSYHNYDVADCN